MSVITDTWRQLVRRRLWPVAALLVAALAAVPLLLAKDPEPVATPSGPAVTTPAEGPGDPIVTLASQEDRAQRRRVLGKRKDPFATVASRRPRKVRARSAGRSRTAARAAVTATSTRDAPSGSTAGPISGGGGATVETPTSTREEAPTPAPKPPAGSLTIRFGSSTAEELERSILEQGRALPDLDTPLLVFDRLAKGGKEAVFLVDASIVADGDGACRPHRTNCQEIHLRAGETEFLDMQDESGDVVAQYQLDLVRINR